MTEIKTKELKFLRDLYFAFLSKKWFFKFYRFKLCGLDVIRCHIHKITTIVCHAQKNTTRGVTIASLLFSQKPSLFPSL